MKSTRRVVLGIAVAAAFAVGQGKFAFADGSLIISSFGGGWGDAIQKGFIDGFEQETGIKVTLLPTQDQAKTVAAINAGNPPDVDITSGGPMWVAGLDRDGFLADIDYSVFDPKVLAQLPEHAKGKRDLVFGVSAISLCYNKAAFPEGKPQPSGWPDYFDVQKFPGKRAQQDWAVGDEGAEQALLGAGVPVNKLYPPDMKLALDTEAKVLPQVLTFTKSPAVLHQLLIDGEVSMAMCFTHRMQKQIDEGVTNVQIVWKNTRLFNEGFAVWKNAANLQNAMKFLAYIVRPDVQARWAVIGRTGPINPAAFDHVPADMKDKLPTSPGHEGAFFTDDQYWMTVGADGKTNFETLTTKTWPDFLRDQNFQ
jgi:putative spermidine/putrescine transport system substrate-binding protein